MQRVARTLTFIVCCLLGPVAAWAQATVAGEVKDASGAVLPGVTVEAASPALIEKVRTAITDGNGRYRIEDLRPGTYTVTFSLAGFGPCPSSTDPAVECATVTASAAETR